jgi:hypothetical protein
MLFDRVKEYFEFIISVSFSVILFFYYPLSSVVFLLFYSLYRNSFYLLFFFSALFDLLFSNFPYEFPRLTLVTFFVVVSVILLKKYVIGNFRNTKISYDF